MKLVSPLFAALALLMLLSACGRKGAPMPAASSPFTLRVFP
ncbi:MAG: lipoprotein [Alphaproteobacteria bacterium]